MKPIKEAISKSLPLLSIGYLAGSGMVCVFCVQMYLGIPANPVIGLLSMFIIFSVYLLNRFTDIKEDFANDIGKLNYFLERGFLRWLGCGALAIAVGMLLVLEKMAFYHVCLFVAGFLYSYPLIPWIHGSKEIRFHRLKEIPLVKNLLVAILWGVSVFAVPLLFTQSPFSGDSPIRILVSAMVLSTLFNTLTADIRDLPGDQLAGNRTLPALLGTTRCYLLMMATWLVWAIFLCVVRIAGSIDQGHFIFLFLFSLYPVVYVLPYHFGKLSRQSLEWLSEADLLLFALGLFVLRGG